MENGKYVDGSLYFYAPNKVTGILPWAALLFLAGYILREIGAFKYGDVDVYISSLVMLYAAPPLYELANYFILSRILYYVPYHSPIHPGRVLTTFGAISSVVEILNGNGAAKVANINQPEKQQEVGRSLLKAALILQLVILSLFIMLAAYFQTQCRKAGLTPKNLRSVLTTLYISSALIGIRTIYRTIEYFSTASLHVTANFNPQTLSPIIRYEWFFWVFEASLMIVNSLMLNVRHPMRWLPRNNRIYLAEDGTTEIEGPGYHDQRLWLVTFLDPFDFVGMAKGRNMQRKFWETQEAERREGVTELAQGVNKSSTVV
ncbi:hypothetical protein B7494_g1817 [Chlorociboria aeruginascens]|nr:hypothetical protein B7494_g1817 [Chlorociboria aeruginascens]